MMPTLDRMGRVGVWTGLLASLPHPAVREAIADIEGLGIQSIWYGESFGRESMALGSLILEASNEIVAASGIANIYGRDATAMVNGARSLAEASDDRFVLGIGVSHQPPVNRRGTEYEAPYDALDTYLTEMSEVTRTGPDPREPVPVVVGALGPQMCQLSARRTQGVHPYFTPVSHTRATRALVSGTFLAPEQMVILTSDVAEARSIAGKTAAIYTRMPNYRRMLLAEGLTEEDLDEFSDALFNAVFVWGDAATCAARVADHLEAGADHVGVQLLDGDPSRFPLSGWSELAPALRELEGVS